jgi:UDP-N-acetylglucosamine 2-epimerase (non-hydrolysing)
MQPSLLAAAGSSVMCVVGARPNFMKIAPVMAALRQKLSAARVRLVHTGQHYDARMNQQYFDALGIPQPDVNLEVGSASHALQTAEIMRRFEPVLDAQQPAAILVVGDVNSTLACALVAAKKGIAVIHVEAGLRSYDRAMPEEINRVLTDQISDLLFITERSARDNLLREGVDPARIHFVGNVMIDTLQQNLKSAISARATLAEASLAADMLDNTRGYAVVTLHRPSNVDEPQVLRSILSTLRQIGARLPIIFPVHPRTREKIAQHGLQDLVGGPGIVQLAPAGYLQMLGLMREARLVLTDSGGIQEETTALGVPCITLRDNTERPITVEEGTNTIAGHDPKRILAVVDEVLRGGGKRGRVPEMWDGHAAVRIAAIIDEWLARGACRKVA